MSLTSSLSTLAWCPWSQSGFGGGFGNFGHGSNAWFGGFHFPFGMVTLLLFAAMVFWFATRTRTPVRQENSSPLEILKRRYASGEINRDEYRRLRAELDA